MSQTSYAINQSAAQGGQLYDLGENDFVSAVDPSEDVPFGVAVAQGSADSECKLPAASGDIAKLLGVAALVQTKEQALLTSIVNYKAGADIAILRKGRIWVKVEENVAAFDPVYVRYTVHGGLDQLGAFRMSADTVSMVDTAGLVSGAKYRTSALAGGFAVVEFNLPA